MDEIGQNNLWLRECDGGQFHLDEANALSLLESVSFKERSVASLQSCRTELTNEFTGLRGFSRRSGGMIGWPAM